MISSNYDLIYSDIAVQILENGNISDDRTGVGTISDFGLQYTLNLHCERKDNKLICNNFPLLTSKHVYWKGILYELLWFLSGDTNISYLLNNNVNIWNADSYRNYVNVTEDTVKLTIDEFIEKCKSDYSFIKKYGNLGKIYGFQWRSKNIDQIKTLIDTIITNPNSRRMIVNSWDVDNLENMVLPPCHNQFQCYVNDGKLYLHLYQRSCDVGLGLPFNTPSYVTLMMILAQLTDTIPYKFIHSFGDVHIYKNHTSALKEQLCLDTYDMPKLIVDEISDIDRIDVGMFHLYNYKSNKSNKMKMNT